MKPLIIFDLDGTLADTAPDLLATLNRVITPHGLQSAQRNEFGTLIGQGARAMILQAFENNNKTISEEQLDQLFNHFIEDYSDNIANDTKLYDGVTAAMNQLENSGFGFAVCTNKTERLAKQLLEELGVMNRFSAITGGDTFTFKKPDGRHIEETISLAAGIPGRSIMIGDSLADIAAAKEAGIPSVAVRFGYSSQPVEELNPDRIIEHFDELSATVEAIAQTMFR